MVSRYADVLKGAKDLLSKSFKYGNNVEVKTNTSSGVTFVGEASINSSVSAGVRAEFAARGVKVDKLSVDTAGKVVGEFSLADAVPHTKVSFKAVDSTQDANAISVSFGTETKLPELGTFTLDVTPFASALEASALFSYDGFLAGGNVKGSFGDKKGLTDYSVLAGYKGKDFTAAVSGESRLTVVGAGYFHTVTPDLTAAAVAKVPVAAKGDVSVEIGAAYRLAADTTVTAKFSNPGVVSVSYAQQISPLTKLTFASSVNAAKIATDTPNFGVQLNIVQ